MLEENVDPQYLHCMMCMRHRCLAPGDGAQFSKGGREETLTMKQGTETILNNYPLLVREVDMPQKLKLYIAGNSTMKRRIADYGLALYCTLGTRLESASKFFLASNQRSLHCIKGKVV